MDYELAKQLKDAGFIFKDPQQAKREIALSLWNPTLSELIEACPKVLFSETYDVDCNFELWWSRRSYDTLKEGWVAVYHWIDGITHEICDDDELSKTPEESVARLWLQLNKRP